MFSFAGLPGTVAAAVATIAPISQAITASGSLIRPPQARQIVVGCGLPEQRVSVAFEQDMQEDVIWIARDRSVLPERTFACVARASLQTIYYVHFRDAAEQRRYDTIYWKIENQLGVSEARKWLAQRNRLSTIPLPNKERLTDYARAVETFCGVKAGSLLVARGTAFITFAPNGLGRLTSNGAEGAAATHDQFECVTKVMSAADLQSKGILFGLIGNAAADVR